MAKAANKKQMFKIIIYTSPNNKFRRYIYSRNNYMFVLTYEYKMTDVYNSGS